MKKGVSYLLIGTVLFLGGACSKNDNAPEPQVLNSSVLDVVLPMDSIPDTTKKENQNPNSVLMKKDLLGKDLVLGGVLTALDMYPETTIGGMTGSFVSPLLVRLSLNEDKKALEMKRSPLVPWYLEGKTPKVEKVIGMVSVEEVTEAGDVVLDLSEMASGLFSGFGRIDRSGLVSGTSFSGHRKEVVRTDDYINFPVVVGFSQEGASATALLRLYIKRWVPNTNFEKRHVNKNFGFFTLFYMYDDYKEYPVIEEESPDDLVLKWDLKNRQSPIEYVISKDTPKLYAEEIKKGVEAWNAPLKNMLGKETDVITARFETEDEALIPGDLKVNYIFWERNPRKGQLGMRASWQNDPITGEIFHADVNAGGESLVQVLGQSYERYYKPDASESEKEKEVSFLSKHFHTICNYNAQPFSDKTILEVKLTKEEWVRTWVRQAIIHELGHNFGLRHNFKGSLTVDVESGTPDSSVMDYHSNDLLLAGLGLETPGAYDLQALTWSETGVVPNNPLPFCTDEQTESYNAYHDPRCRLFDFGADPLAASLVPNLLLNGRLMMEAQSQYDFNRFQGRAFRYFGDVLDFLGQNASEADRRAVNLAVTDIVSGLRQNHATHPKYEEVVKLVLKSFLNNVVQNPKSVGVFQAESGQMLIDVISDFSTEVQLSLETKMDLIDTLTELRGHVSQRDQFIAYKTLWDLKDRLYVELKNLSERRGERGDDVSITYEDYLIEQARQLIVLVEDRMYLFFGRLESDQS